LEVDAPNDENSAVPDVARVGAAGNQLEQMGNMPVPPMGNVDPTGKNKSQAADPSARLGNQRGDPLVHRDGAPQEIDSSANRRDIEWGKDKRHADRDPDVDAGEMPFCDRCKVHGHLMRDCMRGVGGTNQGQAGILPLDEYIAQVDGQTFFLHS
jgi:hypothetical protein